MTIIKKLAMAGSVAAVALATPAFAATYTPPTVSGTATVRLYDAIELLKIKDIDFGTIIRDPGFGGTVTMDAASATDCAAQTGISCTGAKSAGHFTIKGDSGADMSVSLTSATYDPVTNVLQLVNGTNAVDLALNVGGMTQDVDPTLGPQNTFSVTGTGAATDITLAGALTFGDSTVAPNGVYQATFNLTADYK